MEHLSGKHIDFLHQHPFFPRAGHSDRALEAPREFFPFFLARECRESCHLLFIFKLRFGLENHEHSRSKKIYFNFENTNLFHSLRDFGPDVAPLMNASVFINQRGVILQVQSEAKPFPFRTVLLYMHESTQRKKASCRPPSTAMIWPVVFPNRFPNNRNTASAWSAALTESLVRVRFA